MLYVLDDGESPKEKGILGSYTFVRRILKLVHKKRLSGAFAKLHRATISFVICVRLHVRMEKLGSHWTDFHET